MYVGNLSYDATDSDLRELFEAHGTVSDVFIVKDRESDRPRGFAFVSMETPEEMNAAIEGLNGAEFAGRALTINEARPREERPQGGGGGGYGRNSRDDRGTKRKDTDGDGKNSYGGRSRW